MRILLLSFIFYTINSLFAMDAFTDNRNISIVINNSNNNANNNDIVVDRKINSLPEETKINFEDIFTKKKILFMLLLMLVYYVNFFKISSLLSVFVFIKNKIYALWVSRKKRKNEKNINLVADNVF